MNILIFFFSSRRRHTRFKCDWSSDVCSSDLYGPGLSATGVNRLDAFCAATDYSLRHKWWDGTGWFPNPHWENIGGTLTSTPAAVSWGAGRIDVVCRGGGNKLYHKYLDGTAWQPSG